MTLLDLLLIGLGAHRLWTIWLFLPWAARAEARYKANQYGPGVLAWLRRKRDKAMWCHFCLSAHAGVLAVLLWLAPYGIYALAALAAGGVVFIVAGALNLLDATTHRQQVWSLAVRHTMAGTSQPQQQQQKLIKEA